MKMKNQRKWGKIPSLKDVFIQMFMLDEDLDEQMNQKNEKEESLEYLERL